ncbi:DUF4861 family protein [Mucisphaera calidilacus]|uniref:Uncharacterized protein n=1 Tax=Mucisphaera calidilacus TaxID=2527982 RepID=A0A518BWU6_9BACT|nr:DUF4861 family protein [Mucisphaera calidilacus]QDU71445.1 hypothetical protein Pan265_12950 [Mucisphaera calidilacus]
MQIITRTTTLILTAVLGLQASTRADPMVRQYRILMPAVGTVPVFEDLDNDGDPDVLRTVLRDGMPVQWIDDDDDMTFDDLVGDTDSDCLMIDRNKDGNYGDEHDLMIDWGDEDGDNNADLQVVVENATRKDMLWGPGHYMVMVDTDQDGVLNYIDWNDYKLKCWEHTGTSHFFEDYLGHSMFLKIHTSTYNMPDLRYNWENPFLFYDEDGDDICEVAIRLVDSPRQMPAPHEGFVMPEEGSAIKDEWRRMVVDATIDWVSIATDLDNDTVPGNEFDFDMTLNYAGKGFDYADQVHRFKSLSGIREADKFFYDPRWRQLTELIYPDHDAARDLIYNRGEWGRCWLVFDEDDDCERWERVEVYHPDDPFKIGLYKGGIDWHPQSDSSGDRGEWDSDFSGGGKLYTAGFDGRIHLHGAEWGAWRIDQDAHFYQGWSRSSHTAKKFPTIRYADTDDNGFFDRIDYDLDGDKRYERSVSLISLGIDDTATLIDPAELDYQGYRDLHERVTDAMWARAQKAIEAARANQLDLSPYAGMMKPLSTRQKYHYAYWLNFYIYNDLLELAEHRGDTVFANDLDRAYFSGDWSNLTRPLVAPDPNQHAQMRIEVTNPLDQPRGHQTVEIPWQSIEDAMPHADSQTIRVINGSTGREATSQVIDTDANGTPDLLVFQHHFLASQTVVFTLQATPPVRGQNDPSPVHAKFVPTRMDDFAWESDRIAYRMYGPALRNETISNGIDVWSKRVPYPIVEKWYQPGHDYHTDRGEGADLYKVGNTLGCGGTALVIDGQFVRGENYALWRILANGPVRTLFELTFPERRINGITIRETQRLSLDKGHNLTRITTDYTIDGSPDTIEFATGLVRRNPATHSPSPDRTWLGQWGPLGAKGNGDLGAGVVLQNAGKARYEMIENHHLLLTHLPESGSVVHWAGAGWSRAHRFTDSEKWNAYLTEWAKRVNQPLMIRQIKKGK